MYLIKREGIAVNQKKPMKRVTRGRSTSQSKIWIILKNKHKISTIKANCKGMETNKKKIYKKSTNSSCVKEKRNNSNLIQHYMRCIDIEDQIWLVLTMKKFKEACNFKNNIHPLKPVEIICIYLCIYIKQLNSGVSTNHVYEI